MTHAAPEPQKKTPGRKSKTPKYTPLILIMLNDYTAQMFPFNFVENAVTQRS